MTRHGVAILIRPTRAAPVVAIWSEPTLNLLISSPHRKRHAAPGTATLVPFRSMCQTLRFHARQGQVSLRLSQRIGRVLFNLQRAVRVRGEPLRFWSMLDLRMQQPLKVRRRWRPENKNDAEKVRECLEAVLSTPRFASSKRYPALLRYVVEKTLCGESETLKERTIGIEVFSRPPNYDTGSDTVVRYAAGEVRKRLSLYYHEEGAGKPIQIELPAGSYVPDFYVEERLSKSEAVEKWEPSAAVQESGTSTGLSDGPAFLPPVTEPRSRSLRLWRWALPAVLMILCCGAAIWLHELHIRSSAYDAFWYPLREASRGSPVLVCPAAIVFSSNGLTGVDPAQTPSQDAMLSPETARSMSEISDVLGAERIPFTVRLPAVVTGDELSRHPAVLIGAYNNRVTLQAVEDLRYRFSGRATQSIYDATQPTVSWARPRSWRNEPGNDYALFARFRSTRTKQWTYVIAGLGRAGTEAAAAMVTSPDQLASIASRLPPDWNSSNFEVVLRVEVRANRATVEPTVEAVWEWK